MLQRIETGAGDPIPIHAGSNAKLLIDWCDQQLRLASLVAKHTLHRQVFWVCNQDPIELAKAVTDAGYPEIVPPGTV